MSSIKKVLIFLISLVVSLYTLLSVGSFMLFLSTPRKISTTYTWIFNLLDNKSKWEIVFGPLFFDYIYIACFILQHSVMKSQLVKKLIGILRLSNMERLIYNLTSSLSLHYLIQNWTPAESVVLWQVNATETPALWWTFVLIHVFAWAVVFGGSIIMDASEMLGMKQAYYNMNNYAQPMAYKSFEMRHLFTHIRHPSFVGLCVILWATNLMTIDRLLLAFMLTAYMYIAWSTDRSDVTYQKYMLRKRMSIRTQ